jgi:hypothetical protein
MAQRIGIVLFNDVEELDAVGPWEVLAYWALNYPDDGVEISSLSPRGGEVTAAKGLKLVAQYSFADAPGYDVLLHPGGQGTRPQMRDEEYHAASKSSRNHALGGLTAMWHRCRNLRSNGPNSRSNATLLPQTGPWRNSLTPLGSPRPECRRYAA